MDETKVESRHENVKKTASGLPKTDENQYGAGVSNPFTKMTFESFDKLHTKEQKKDDRKM